MVFGTRYVIKTGPTVAHNQLHRLLLVWQATFVAVKLNLPHMLHLRRHIGPHAKNDVFLLALEGELLLGVTLDFPVLVLLPLLHQLLVCVGGVVLDVREDLLRNLIVLGDHDPSNLLDVVVAPLNLLVIILRQGFPKN